MTEAPKRILFFDGVCNLCNGFVDFMMKRDDSLLFASLQSEVAQKTLNLDPSAELSSVIYCRQGIIYKESSGALRAIADLGGLWRLFLIFLIVPAPIRDGVYRWVAKNRYKWFGKQDTCRLPTQEEKNRFL